MEVWIAIVALILGLLAFGAVCIVPTLREPDYDGIVPELRQSTTERNPMAPEISSEPARAVFVNARGVDLLALCPECWGTGRALLPHTDIGWAFCDCPTGEQRRQASKMRP